MRTKAIRLVNLVVDWRVTRQAGGSSLSPGGCGGTLPACASGVVVLRPPPAAPTGTAALTRSCPQAVPGGRRM
eukprot:1196368-Prorocentrum_minimum.AAC.4